MKLLFCDIVTLKRKPLSNSEYYSRVFKKAFGKKHKPERPILKREQGEILIEEMSF
jgi:hypothetical protein